MVKVIFASNFAPVARTECQRMTNIKWIEAFATGDGEIDDEHRHLVTLMQRIEEKVRERDSETCRKLLDGFLVEIEEHFSHEETRLTTIGYPRGGEHANKHKELLARAAVVRDTCLDCTTDEEVDACLEALVSFLLDDFIGADTEIKAYLQDHVEVL